MEQALEQVRDQQKETWNKFSSGWRKWDDFTMNVLSLPGKEIIAALTPKETDSALDIATGTGEPGLSIARIVTKGTVIGTDLSEGMLEVARDQAKAQGITNYSTEACDVSQLPFADQTFEVVSCRFGFMFFPDVQKAAYEMARVLKPDGRISVSVWAGPESNPWVTAITKPLNEVLALPQPPAGAPGIFRCAAPGMIEALFQTAGLKNIRAKDVFSDWDFSSKELYWEYMNDVVAPVVSAMSKATPEQKEMIRSKSFAMIDSFNPGGGAVFKSHARVISAEK